MVDRETVIAALEYCAVGTKDCHGCPMKDKCKGVSNGAMAAAIELLKNEYEFVKVKHHDISKADDTTFDDEFWCEGCGTMWQVAKEEVNFCPGCGRKVKLDE